MSTSELKVHLHQLIDKTDDETTLSRIYKLLSKSINGTENSDWWTDLSDKAKVDIEEGIRQANNNELISHDSMRSKIDQYLSQNK